MGYVSAREVWRGLLQHGRDVRALHLRAREAARMR